MGDRGGFDRGFGGRGGDRGGRGDRGDRGRGRGRGRPRARKDDEEKWVPCTKLGRLVQQVSICNSKSLTALPSVSASRLESIVPDKPCFTC